jgi:ABC-type dipeptide/oligopeptide/nickel transport system permease subunit
MDAWLALPGVLVAVILVGRFGVSLSNLILSLGFMGVPVFYRVVRNTAISTRQMPYVEAAIALGASGRHIIWRHILPNIVSSLIVLTTTQMATTLLTGSSLSFIGLGAQPPTPEWGALLAAGKNYMDTAWWLAVAPGLAVTLTVLGLMLLGDGLRDYFDPRSRVDALKAAGGPVISLWSEKDAVSGGARKNSMGEHDYFERDGEIA